MVPNPSTVEIECPWLGITGTPAEFVWGLYCGVLPEVARHRSISVQTVYIDETQSSKTLRMAGFVSSVERWAKFAMDWDAELKADPPITHFHGKDILSKSGEGVFGAIAVEDRFRKVERLIDIINRHTVMDFAASMSLSEYERTLGHAFKFSKKFKKNDYPYVWLFVIGVLVGFSTVDVMLRGGNESHFIFDKHGLFARATRQYERVEELIAPEFDVAFKVVRKIDQEDDREFLPLQAADLLAWHLNRAESGADQRITANLKRLHSVNRPSFEWAISEDALKKAERGLTTRIIYGRPKRRLP